MLHLNIPISVDELATLIREQLSPAERLNLVQLLSIETDEEPTQAQLVAEMKQAVQELNLVKKGQLKARPLQELLDEL